MMFLLIRNRERATASFTKMIQAQREYVFRRLKDKTIDCTWRFLGWWLHNHPC